MVKLSDKRRIAAHQFWLWEYQRRNLEYKETYDSLMRKLSLLKINYIEIGALPGKKLSKFSKKDLELYENIVDDKNRFIDKFDTKPKDYLVKEGYDSENILQTILSRNEKSLFLPYVVNWILKATELPNYNRVDGYTEWPYLTVRLDLTEDIDLIKQEVTFLYYEFLLKKKLDSREYKLVTTKDMVRKIIDKMSKFFLKKKVDSREYSERKNIAEIDKERQKSLNKLLKLKKGLRQGSLEPLPRAAGLWLWDQWDKKGKASQNEIIKKFFSEVIDCKGGPFFSDEKKVQLIFLNGKERNAYLEPRHLSRILSKTDECIEKMKVLPMK